MTDSSTTDGSIGFLTPRRLKWLKWVVLVVWLALIAGIGPLAGKLSGAQKNDATAFLPGNAESTKVFNELKTFPGGDAVPVVIVYNRASGLTPADRDFISERRAAIGGYIQVVRTGTDVDADLPIIPSQDGKSALISLKVKASDNGNTLLKWIDEVRDRSRADLPAGLQTDVTGPGGYLRDSLKAFEGIDGKLLIVTVIVVAVILLLTYRSLFLWLMPLVSVGFAAATAQGVVYLLTKAGLVVNGQSAGILTVLVFGAGTDYALLLIARYREELHHTSDRHLAMARAYKQAAPALLASGSTVTIGLLCLLFSQLESDKGLGPVGAVGVLCALAAQLTLLPSLLLIFGRKLFWPFIPKVDAAGLTADGPWVRMSHLIGRHPRRIWIGTLAVLIALCFGLFSFNTGLTQEEGFRDKAESVTGQQLIAQSFPAGASQPATVIANASASSAVVAAAKGPGIVQVIPLDKPSNGRQQIDVVLDQPDGPAANTAIRQLRDRVHAVPGADALVGGQTATTLDVNDASSHDVKVIIPIVLVVVLVILGILLRAIFAPILLMLTVVLSYLSSLGLAALIFDWGFDFPGSDPSLPLFAFIFLVALGIDYNIFLMSRVREESVRGGTRYGTLRGVATTGGVITSAGIVLAATFSVLGVLPLVQLIQVGIVVAVGVLLDTFVVRSLLVPALTLEIGSKVWWPSKLQHVPDHPDAPEPHLPMQASGERAGTSA